MIERQEIRFVGAVDFTDDCRVEVQLRKRRMTLTVTEARQLRAELDAAIGEASRAADDLVGRAVIPLGPDMLICPDCRDEKHAACVGRAWDAIGDCEQPCECPHLSSETAA